MMDEESESLKVLKEVNALLYNVKAIGQADQLGKSIENVARMFIDELKAEQERTRSQTHTFTTSPKSLLDDAYQLKAAVDAVKALDPTAGIDEAVVLLKRLREATTNGT